MTTKANLPGTYRVPKERLKSIEQDYAFNGEFKDKLSITSLNNQIESGLEMGHSENEIIETVIKAVSPVLHLRDLLVTTKLTHRTYSTYQWTSPKPKGVCSSLSVQTNRMKRKTALQV